MPRLKAVTIPNSTGTCFANQGYRFETASEISPRIHQFPEGSGEGLSNVEDLGRLRCSASDSMASGGPPSDMVILLYFSSLSKPLAAYLVPGSNDRGTQGVGI